MLPQMRRVNTLEDLRSLDDILQLAEAYTSIIDCHIRTQHLQLAALKRFTFADLAEAVQLMWNASIGG
ncbi:hypothetical protein FGIG_01853 [Fasciola gigantica]|uniref:Uncharacterized protein n=1 Tax=Fasciola gigantica TaxID=46835 RepID=A0A504YW42_FASGI|nr:hypothetical protein FGIG_01853 [Fasciola gigantica]